MSDDWTTPQDKAKEEAQDPETEALFATPPPKPEPTPAPPPSGGPATPPPAPTLPPDGEPAGAVPLPTDKPEVLIGGALAGGFLAALILKRLGRR